MMDFVRRIHFVGIGGVGMSGIAQVLLNLGYSVSGSDLKATELTRRLAAAGAEVRIGHRAANIRGAEVVVISTAVPPSNPEVAAARAAGIPVARRVELLAEIARLKKTITVSGTHGKTTTTAMAAMALQAAGADPTVIVGGQVANLEAESPRPRTAGGSRSRHELPVGGTNARVGLGEYLVAEADESDGSFLKLYPLVAVVTNIDDDHLEHYGGFSALKKAFLEHLHHLPFYGTAVLCADDPVLRGLMGRVRRPVVTYGLAPGSGSGRRAGTRGGAADWCGVVLPAAGKGGLGAGTRMAVYHQGRKKGVLKLRVAGRHNALNALAAVAVGGFLGLDLRKVFRGLSSFSGVGRRMERLGEAGGIDFIDDYGHHPTEVRATLEALAGTSARRGPAAGRRWAGKRRIVAVFQPHRYSRTKALHRAFGPAVRKADAVYVMDIYPAGERPIPGVTSKLILDAVRRAGVPAYPFTRPVDLVRELREGDVVLTLGAGDVWKVGMDLLRRLQSRTFVAL
ncbi:MAG: UDP-N-acetylmuramate--L-alanine ligase [Elusimicrobiota bacterium]